MKRLPLFLFIAAFSLLARAEKLTFIPVWTPQAQFAGYYVAHEMGYYTDEGLDVTIEHVGINSSQTPLAALMEGHAQIIGQQLMQAIVYRSNGAPIVNILQTSQNNSLMCVSRTPMTKLEDLNGKKIGTWTSGHSEAFNIMAADKGLNIEMIPSMQSLNLYMFDAIDATLCYAYNEYIQLLLAKGEIAEEQIVRLSDLGYNYPEDGIYVMEDWLKDHANEAARFVRATMRGWRYCRSYPDKALDIVMKYVHENDIVTSYVHQKMMLEEILRQQMNPKTQKVDFQYVSRELFDEIAGKMHQSGMFEQPVTYNELIHPLSVVRQQ